MELKSKLQLIKMYSVTVVKGQKKIKVLKAVDVTLAKALELRRIHCFRKK